MNTAEIKSYLLEVINVFNQKQAYQLEAVCLLLFNTGLRFEEVRDISRWQMLANGDAIVQTAKRGNIRQIDKRHLSPSLLHSINTQINYFCPYTYSQFANQFEQFKPYRTVGRGTKCVTTHLFRHHYIKQKWDDGLTATDIANHIGMRSVPTTLFYIKSIINHQ